MKPRKRGLMASLEQHQLGQEGFGEFFSKLKGLVSKNSPSATSGEDRVEVSLHSWHRDINTIETELKGLIVQLAKLPELPSPGVFTGDPLKDKEVPVDFTARPWKEIAVALSTPLVFKFNPVLDDDDFTKGEVSEQSLHRLGISLGKLLKAFSQNSKNVSESFYEKLANAPLAEVRGALFDRFELLNAGKLDNTLALWPVSCNGWYQLTFTDTWKWTRQEGNNLDVEVIPYLSSGEVKRAIKSLLTLIEISEDALRAALWTESVAKTLRKKAGNGGEAPAALAEQYAAFGRDLNREALWFIEIGASYCTDCVKALVLGQPAQEGFSDLFKGIKGLFKSSSKLLEEDQKFLTSSQKEIEVVENFLYAQLAVQDISPAELRKLKFEDLDRYDYLPAILISFGHLKLTANSIEREVTELLDRHILLSKTLVDKASRYDEDDLTDWSTRDDGDWQTFLPKALITIQRGVDYLELKPFVEGTRLRFYRNEKPYADRELDASADRIPVIGFDIVKTWQPKLQELDMQFEPLLKLVERLSVFEKTVSTHKTVFPQPVRALKEYAKLVIELNLSLLNPLSVYIYECLEGLAELTPVSQESFQARVAKRHRFEHAYSALHKTIATLESYLAEPQLEQPAMVGRFARQAARLISQDLNECTSATTEGLGDLFKKVGDWLKYKPKEPPKRDPLAELENYKQRLAKIQSALPALEKLLRESNAPNPAPGLYSFGDDQSDEKEWLDLDEHWELTNAFNAATDHRGSEKPTVADILSIYKTQQRHTAALLACVAKIEWNKVPGTKGMELHEAIELLLPGFPFDIIDKDDKTRLPTDYHIYDLYLGGEIVIGKHFHGAEFDENELEGGALPLPGKTEIGQVLQETRKLGELTTRLISAFEKVVAKIATLDKDESNPPTRWLPDVQEYMLLWIYANVGLMYDGLTYPKEALRYYAERHGKNPVPEAPTTETDKLPALEQFYSRHAARPALEEILHYLKTLSER